MPELGKWPGKPSLTFAYIAIPRSDSLLSRPAIVANWGRPKSRRIIYLEELVERWLSVAYTTHGLEIRLTAIPRDAARGL